MQISSLPKHLFWQYQPDADLPDLVVLENLLRYGDLDDLLNVPRIFSVQQIAEIKEKMEVDKRWKKRMFFIEKILLPQ